uniref:Avidin n=1 Tax=Salvator merianae TaxID=96440 RepID=A0A8D0KMK7_SALMN
MATQAALLALLASCLLVLADAASLAPLADADAEEEGAEATKCNLTGTWVNELGSKMTIKAVDRAGNFMGSYWTAVSSTNQPIPRSPLHGGQQSANARGQPTFGFTVNWLSTGSTTVFVGQCFVNSNGEETLETSWLLRSQVAARGDDWKATRVGRNMFTRFK